MKAIEHSNVRSAAAPSLHSIVLRCSLLFALCGLAACERFDSAPVANVPAPAPAVTVDPEISWADRALRRNPNLEVLATDQAAGVFTVRNKSTGEVRALKTRELAAAPIADLFQSAAAASQPATAPVPTEPVTEPAAPAPKIAVAKIERTDATSLTPPPDTVVPRDDELSKNYTIDRTGGQVKISGPGVSIVSTGAANASGKGALTARNPEPVICEGSRMLHLDNRVITASGNAVIARGGCELYITNSRISALGTGVIVGDAIVHIANSTIEGTTASFDADDGARMFVRSSIFKGVARRAEQAVVQDQGGNQWR